MDNLKKEGEMEEEKNMCVGKNDIIFKMWNRSWVISLKYVKKTINHLPRVSEREFTQQNYDLHGQRKEKKKK